MDVPLVYNNSADVKALTERFVSSKYLFLSVEHFLRGDTSPSGFFNDVLASLKRCEIEINACSWHHYATPENCPDGTQVYFCNLCGREIPKNTPNEEVHFVQGMHGVTHSSCPPLEAV